MSKYLKDFLISNHTDNDGTITIDDSAKSLMITADLIREESSTDYDCMVEELLESDEIRSLCESMVNQRGKDSLKCMMDLEKLAAKNLVETTDRLLRAG